MDRASFAYQNVFSITITVKIEQEWLSEGFNVITGEGGQKLKEAVKRVCCGLRSQLTSIKGVGKNLNNLKKRFLHCSVLCNT